MSNDCSYYIIDCLLDVVRWGAGAHYTAHVYRLQYIALVLAGSKRTDALNLDVSKLLIG